MAEVSVLEANTHLSCRLRRVTEGEDIVIAKGGKPVARLVPVRRPGRRQLGCARGLWTSRRTSTPPCRPEGV